MTENEIVLSLLKFYKDKGLDLYKILDDPSFKALSLETKLTAIKRYAQDILSGTPQTFGKKDFKSLLRGALIHGGIGMAAGGMTAFGTAATFSKGRVPPEVILGGAMVGAIGGAAGSLFDTLIKSQGRTYVGNELKQVIANPSTENAFNVLTANGLKSDPDNQNKFLGKIQNQVNSALDDRTKTFATKETEHYNEHVLGNKKL
jgi:hypothetical protein